MKEYKIDTSADYDDLVGYISEENLPSNLTPHIGIEETYTYNIKGKATNSEFPEQWQSLIVTFDNLEDYAKFMIELNVSPSVKIKELVYNPEDKETSILNFF